VIEVVTEVAVDVVIDHILLLLDSMPMAIPFNK